MARAWASVRWKGAAEAEGKGQGLYRWPAGALLRWDRQLREPALRYSGLRLAGLPARHKPRS